VRHSGREAGPSLKRIFTSQKAFQQETAVGRNNKRHGTAKGIQQRHLVTKNTGTCTKPTTETGHPGLVFKT
jgi:hypothetical protein